MNLGRVWRVAIDLAIIARNPRTRKAPFVDPSLVGAQQGKICGKRYGDRRIQSMHDTAECVNKHLFSRLCNLQVVLPRTMNCVGKIAGAAKSDRKSTRLNSSHITISYAVFCLKKKKKNN